MTHRSSPRSIEYPRPGRIHRSAHPHLTAICTALLLLAVTGCDNSFSPKAAYEERIVVFGVLDASQSAQIVRLETTYDAEGSTPDVPIGRRTIDSAKVVIASERRAWICDDTLITAADGTMRKIWLTRAFRPEEGHSYRLVVNVPGLPEITSTVTVPSKAYVQMISPIMTASKRGVEVRAGTISQVAPPKGFYFRLFVVGRKNVGGSMVEVRREVPLRYEGADARPVMSEPARESVSVFSTEAVATIKGKLEGVDGASNIQLLATAYTMDAYLYNYFQTVRGFDDPVSVRQDRPDVTNISGGVGVFGALVADSVRAAYSTIITSAFAGSAPAGR